MDKVEIRRILNLQREWSLYPLADLDEGLFEQCGWWTRGNALAMVFRGIVIRPIFVLGDAESARALLTEMPEQSGYLNILPEHEEAARGIYEYRERHEMQRMMLDGFRPRTGAVVPLTLDEAEEIERLYETGDGGGIAFGRFQLRTGFFRGIRKSRELVAVAGVQVASHNEGVAAVGNIFVRPDCRGQGLAQVVTSAVVEAVLDSGITTIGLNVERANQAAVHAYKAIGFRDRLHYCEGVAVRVQA